MSARNSIDFPELYHQFEAPITHLNCGEKCAPYNERGVPFCCDTRHAVPTAYEQEFVYLQENTDMWNPWQADNPRQTAALQAETPEGQTLIACQGHLLCQRSFRSITCRSFPFFPYLTRQDDFIGLSYYWDYEDRCWVISNLAAVTPEYRSQFITAYEALFRAYPDERENFRSHSDHMRRVFGRRKRAIPLLHRNGAAYKITPRTERMRRVPLVSLPKFGPYHLAAEMPFPGEEALVIHK